MKRRPNRVTDIKAAVLSGLRISGEEQPASSRRGNFIIVGLGILLTMLPVTMIVPVLKELVSIRFQVASFWAHAFMSTSLIGAIISAPLAGIIVDRTQSRRRVIFFALAGNGICFLIMALAPSFLILMTARFVEGAMHITALSAWMAAGADISPGGRSGRVMGALGGMLMLGISIGVPLGGIIAGEESIRVLWAAAFVSWFATVFSLLLHTRHTRDKASSVINEFVNIIRENPYLSLPYIYTFIDRLCVGVVVSTFTLYMTDILELSPAQRGMELAFFLFPFAALSYPVGRLSDSIGRVWLMAAGSLLFGVVFMFYGFLNGVWLPSAMVASGVLSAIMFAPTLAMCKDLSPVEKYGTAFAGYNVAGSLGFIVGPLLGGSLFAWFSVVTTTVRAYRWTFVIAGSFEVLCALITFPFLIKLYRNRREVN